MTGFPYDWVAHQAERAPERPAVVMHDSRLSYGELEVTSNQLAHALRDAGLQRCDRVALLLAKGPRAITAMLGAQKAGAAYVPLDLDSPAPRLAAMLRSAEPAVMVVDEAGRQRCTELWPLLEGIPRPALAWVSDAPPDELPVAPALTWTDLAALRADLPWVAQAEHDPLYIMFTSGSTGTPKGVVITHANVRAFVEWAVASLGMLPDDRLSGHAPLHFDLSTFDIYGAFAAGATLYPVAPALNLFPGRLAAFIRANRLTQWFSAPSILTYLAKFDALRAGDFPEMRCILWCGEVFPTPALMYWMTRLPHAVFTNLYGPTETTVASSYYTVPAGPQDAQAVIPIGRPCGGEWLLVLDETMRPCPPGTVGDLYIGGAGMSPGYWRDEAKTRAAFVPDPTGRSDRLYRTGDLAKVGADGLYYFVGRRDTQIKSRGHRIELGEIETTLNADPAVQECAVVSIASDGFENQTICCAYAAGPGVPATGRDLRHRLATRLPPYMLPVRWRRFARLPKNANGKIDRQGLKELFAADEARSA